MSEENDARRNIIIVGAGMAGIAVWNELKLHGLDESKYTVTLITPQPYFIHRLGENRAAVTSDGDWDEKSWIPLGDKFNEGNNKLVIGSVVSISEQEDERGSVVLHDGREFPYAYLVLATGSSWGSHLAFPESKSESKAWAANWRAKFEKAQNIVIVGGGVIGVETAGELKSFYPDKKVTLVHVQEHLLNRSYPLWWRQRLTAHVESLGVELIFNDYVDQSEVSSDGTVSTREGRKFPTDLLLQARGPKPITNFIKSSLGDDTVTQSGYVRVRPTLQLQLHPNIFAVGDIMDWDEQKQAAKAFNHAAVVAKNIVSLTLRQGANISYYGSVELIMITLGKERGYGYVGVLWGIAIPNWLSAWHKSGNLHFEMVREKLHL